VGWGSVIMIGTGLLLWFYDFAMTYLPRWAWEIAKAIHSWEAVLAFLAIIIWHMYNVHLNPSSFPMNMAWLTGRISERELREEHPLEYEQVIAEGAAPGAEPLREGAGPLGELTPGIRAWAFAAALVLVVGATAGMWLIIREEHRAAMIQAAGGMGEGMPPGERTTATVPAGRFHPPNWISIHQPKSGAAAKQCSQCHRPSFCDSCHRTARPSNHGEPNWSSQHSWAVTQTNRNCRICHANGFCVTCHESHLPTSHMKRWPKLHGAASMLEGANCALCHPEAYCDKCHQGMQMPHPETFTKKHQAIAKRDDRQCFSCHQKAECATCHRGTKPDSHNAGWTDRHGKVAAAKGQDCSMCHDQTFCSGCHRGMEMPHPAGWLAAKHQAASKKDSSVCLACHTQEYCQKCHGMQMPHPSDWMPRHGREAENSPALCARCHKPGARPYCLKCHQSLPPRSHTAQFKKDHAPATTDKRALCALCHASSPGRDACLTCHRVPMPHPQDFAVQHAKVASFKPDSPCFRCHTRQNTCDKCHAPAPKGPS